MSALASRLRGATRAATLFLRGFTGIADSRPLGTPGVERGAHPHDASGRPARSGAPTPAEVRRALEERAARRPTCC
ncbi:hypothetical protein MYXO_00769 [Myxococcaceae bacterium]|jgi:hypothetical protein|nr:hypothetical protein MYXO_00769 [Myxococcaceae bacterium]